MSKLENKMTIKMVAENFGVLQRNGYDLVCPIIQPQTIRQIVKGSLGQPQEQISVQKTSCNTICPLFKVNNDDTISVCCGAVEVVHKIEKIIELLDSNEEQIPKILNFNKPNDIN